MKTNGTVKMLVLSAVSVVLCLVMLLGATFAWFSNTVTSGTNIIRTGDFKVAIQFWAPTKDDNNAATAFDDGLFADLANTSQLFNDTLAPGEDTGVKYLKIENTNSYDVNVSISIGITEAAGIPQVDENNNSAPTSELLFYNANGMTAPISSAAIVAGTPTILDAIPASTEESPSAISVLNNQTVVAGQTIYVALAVGLDDDAVHTDVNLQFVITVGAIQVENSNP